MAGVSLVTGDCTDLALENTFTRCLFLAGSEFTLSVFPRRLYMYTRPEAITAAAMPIPSFLFISNSLILEPQL